MPNRPFISLDTLGSKLKTMELQFVSPMAYKNIHVLFARLTFEYITTKRFSRLAFVTVSFSMGIKRTINK